MEDYAQRVPRGRCADPSGRVVAYGDIARALGEGGARNVGTVMSRYGSDVPWWRVIRADGRPPQGHDAIAIEHWRAEGTPMVRGLVDGGRADMARARWSIPRPRRAGWLAGRTPPCRALGRRHRRGQARVGLAARPARLPPR